MIKTYILSLRPAKLFQTVMRPFMLLALDHTALAHQTGYHTNLPRLSKSPRTATAMYYIKIKCQRMVGQCPACPIGRAVAA